MYEYLVLLLTAAVALNRYFDNRLFAAVYARYRKHFHVAAILLLGLALFYSMRCAADGSSRDWVRLAAGRAQGYVPDDMRASVHPLLDLTARGLRDAQALAAHPQRPGAEAHTRKTARSVSESRKKLVAANQRWRCALCRQTLPPTYEVDHVLRLEYGGSNDCDNLQALCPNCHRYKTMMEK